MGALAIPLMLAGGSAAASAINTRRTAKKQDRAAAEKIRNQGRKQQEADARVNATLDGLKASNPQAERAGALAEYVAQLRANNGGQSGLGTQVGRTSDAFADAAADAALGVSETTGRLAGQMATQDGATRQRQREGRDQVALGADIGMIRREADGQAFLDDMRINSIRRNPWLDFASAALGSLAGAGAASAAAGGKSGALTGMAGAANGLGSLGGIGAGLGGGTRYLKAAQANNPFAMYGRPQ